MQILINHIGYEKKGPKKAVINSPMDIILENFLLKEQGTNQTKYSGHPIRSGEVDNWQGFYFWSLDFSDYTGAGQYYIEISTGGKTFTSGTFEIADRVLEKHTLPDVLNYFVSQHCTGRFDRMDRSTPFHGSRKDRVDVHGGWYDASGDNSKYLSHLSHANYMNPQQTPMTVWNFLAAADLFAGEKTPTRELIYSTLVDEAAHGGDFLVRMKDPDGYFYIMVHNTMWKVPEERIITNFTREKSFSENYRAGYREGAGIAIAALARLSAQTTYGDYGSTAYLETAVQAFDHLQAHNSEYLNDGKENIIDDYCALLAATELYNATGEDRFYLAAEKRSESLRNRQMKNGKYPGGFWADNSQERPYFHAVEAGLPVIALLRFLDIEKSGSAKKDILDAVRSALDFELSITNEVNNPFGYARQYVKGVDEQAHSAFFIPHNNESGYWWQGENARLGSLAAMAFQAVHYFKDDREFCGKLIRYGLDQLNWILGLNPFDSCMLHGRGRNNKDYYDPLPLVLGGICNGVTSGFEDESDIAFAPENLINDPAQIWRWTEQWIPHGAWYALAAGALSALF